MRLENIFQSKRPNDFTSCTLYFQNKPMRLDTFNELVSLTYQLCNFIYDIRGYVCQWSTSSMVKYQQILSAEVGFRWIKNKHLSFKCKINTTSPSYFRYFNYSIMMIFRKNIFKMFNWNLTKQTSHGVMNDLKREALKIYMYWLQEGMKLCV